MERQYHVIVAEDEVINALALAVELEVMGLRVTMVHDGYQALSADLHDEADVLLTDLHMPRLCGEELIQRLRTRRPTVPVVIMSAQAIPPHLLDDPIGPTRAVSKPANVDDVMRALRGLLPPLDDPKWVPPARDRTVGRQWGL